MPFFRTPTGYSLHYELHGDGREKLLLIMGFGCCKGYWSGLVERLLQWGGDTPSDEGTPMPRTRYQLCVFDSRGFGLSGDAFARYSSSSLARDTKGLLMHLGWIRAERDLLANDLEAHHSRVGAFQRAAARDYQPPPLHILGWSMGGMIATELMLDLVNWTEHQRRTHGPEYKCADFRSSVIAASSRGGFTHRGEKHDAEPVLLESKSSAAASSKGEGGLRRLLDHSWLSRCLRRQSNGRYGWGMAWPLRNVPPLDGLVRMFKCVFLSLYHSRIERVLELHYSQSFLNQPYQSALTGVDKQHAPPPSSALSHLPMASAAMTSAAKNTIEVHSDRTTGGFSYSQQSDSESPSTVELADRPFVEGVGDVDGEDTAASPLSSSGSNYDVGDRSEEEHRPSPAELAQPPITLEMTPAQKKRVLRIEQGLEDGGDEGGAGGVGETKEELEARWQDESSRRAPARRSSPPASSAAASYAASFSLPPKSPHRPGRPAPRVGGPSSSLQPAASSSSSSSVGATCPTSPRSTTSGPLSSSTSRPLTNRDVLASTYLLRAPFDRFIVLYLFALLGHGLTCLTHHVSRQRIRAFRAQLRAAEQRRDAHLLRCCVITGDADILVHPSNSYHLSEQLACPLYVLENVGHMLHTEQPDAFAQLLHAHFTRTPVEHLQAYTHTNDAILTPMTPGTPARRTLSRVGSSMSLNGPAEGATNLTVTRLEAEPTPSGLHPPDEVVSAEERAMIASRASSSRRNSFLIQIDEPTTGGGGGVGGVGTPRLQRADSRSSFSSPGHAAFRSRSGSVSSLARGRSSSGLSHHGSLADLRQERQRGCCTKVLTTLFFMPFSTAAAVAGWAAAAPKTAWHYMWHPLETIHIPARCFGHLKATLGGTVLKRAAGAPAGTDDQQLTARIVV